MKKPLPALLLAGALSAAVLAGPTLAALAPGAMAPEFSAPAFLAGKPFTFDLNQALAKGPVVLYFFPAAHTHGCNIEAHLFADAIDQFAAQGATVIGVTAGKVDELGAFSAETEHCSGKFPVAADADKTIFKRYDTSLPVMGGISGRTSYVITPDHKVIFAYDNLDPSKHVGLTLGALKDWRAKHPA